MSIFRWLAKAIEATCSGLAYLGQFAIFLMFPLISLDVFLRYAFSKPIPGVFEVVQLMNVVAMTMTLAYVQQLKQHVFVDLLITRFPPRLQFALGVFFNLLALAFFAMLAWRMTIWSAESWAIRERTMGLINFPMYEVKMLIAFGSGIMSLMLIVHLVRDFSNLLRPPAVVERKKAEF